MLFLALCRRVKHTLEVERLPILSNVLVAGQEWSKFGVLCSALRKRYVMKLWAYIHLSL